MVEQFRNEIMTKMSNVLTNEQLVMLDACLSEQLYFYDVSRKETELVVYDNFNERMIKQLIASMRLEGRSENTISQYQMALNHLLDDVPKRLDKITTNDIRYHLAKYQQTHNCEISTVYNKRSYLSAIFAWFHAEEIISKNPMLSIKQIKVEKKVKNAFTDEEIERLKKACETEREIAAIEFLLSSACRVTEVTNICLSDVDWQHAEVIVHGKGNKQRRVYISERCMYHLKEYIATRTDNEKWLFVNARNKQLTKETFEHLIDKIAKRANMEDVHPHKFRRTFATNALYHGMPIQSVQKILGHSNINTTLGYCSINDYSIKSDFNRVA